MEKVMIEHPLHEHSLILRESVGNEERVHCYGCTRGICIGERVYRCVEGERCSSSSSSEIIFHQKCCELPTQISLPSIHSHPLYLAQPGGPESDDCSVCGLISRRELRYRCSRCPYKLDLRCKERVESESLREPTPLKLDCHVHPLRLLIIPPSLFSCDACGTDDHDMLYACTTCGFLVHKTCALLPPLHPTDHHHHQLCLFTNPYKFRRFMFGCHICSRGFNFVSWVYFCPICEFSAHLKCVASELKFPLEEHDVYQKLIRPFVILERNKILGVPNLTTPRTKESDSTLIFNFDHMHALSFVSDQDVDNDGDDDDTDDDDDDGVTMKKICDACATLISSPPYYECAQCNYFVHSDCYSPPKTLSPLQSHELYGNCPKTNKTHNFTASKEKEQSMCDICDSPTKGMVYGCKDCGMKMDVKCASLPTSIVHAYHPDHKLVKRRVEHEDCHACGHALFGKIAYRSSGDKCHFVMCPKCVLLPNNVMKWEWDEHLLPLTYDASIDHPAELYCEICEEEINSKEWMYRCGPCDNSFHLKCV